MNNNIYSIPSDIEIQRLVDPCDDRLEAMTNLLENFSGGDITARLWVKDYENAIADCRKTVICKIKDWFKNRKHVPNSFESQLLRLYNFIKDMGDKKHHINYIDNEFTHVLRIGMRSGILEISHFSESSEKLKGYKLRYPFILLDYGKIQLLEMFVFDVKTKTFRTQYKHKTDDEDFWDRLRFFPAAESDIDLNKACSAIELYIVRMI